MFTAIRRARNSIRTVIGQGHLEQRSSEWLWRMLLYPQTSKRGAMCGWSSAAARLADEALAKPGRISEGGLQCSIVPRSCCLTGTVPKP